MRGEMVHEYTAEELAAMTEDEVYSAICRDLYVNAYAEQKKHDDRYPGRGLAEGLQYAAYLCPSCCRFGTISTHGDRLWCSCGLHAEYTETGNFRKTSGSMPFSNFSQWNRFQKKWMKEHASELKKYISTPIAADKGFRLRIKQDGKTRLLSRNASFAIYGDRLEIRYGNEIKAYSLESEVTGFGMFLSRSMYFNCGTLRYQLVSSDRISTLKYYALWRVLSGRDYQ